MSKQETILYEDTYNIHITKDYVDNILIEEKHYDTNGQCIYSYNYNDNVYLRYYYPIQLEEDYTIFFQLRIHGDKKRLTKVTYNPNPYGLITGSNEIQYDIDDNTCTEICTMNNHDAIKYIKEYIKTYVLKLNNLI
jgi:hypothetical protein